MLSREPLHNLADEQELLTTLLSQEIESGSASVEILHPRDLPARCQSDARRSMCSCLLASTSGTPFASQAATVTRLRLDAAVPSWSWGEEPWITPEEPGLGGWQSLLRQLLVAWL